MNEFSFQNKAYDLLLNLKEDGFILDKPIESTNELSINSIKELRLMIDIIKTNYPLYQNADNKTISDFVKDLFDIKAVDWQIIKANQPIEDIRLARSTDIRPNIPIQLEGTYIDNNGKPQTYYYTNSMPDIKDPLEYHKHFHYIYKKVQQDKGRVINKYKFKIGDIVSTINKPLSIGVIKGRLPSFKPSPILKPYEVINNSYSIIWEDKTQLKPYYWYSEDELQLSTKLEAMPMKTEETIKISRTERRRLYAKSYKERKRLNKHKNKNKVVVKDPWKLNTIAPVTNRQPKYEDKLVCVKYLPTETVSRIRLSKANKLVEKDGYDFATKLEYRKYRNKVAENKLANFPKQFSQIGKDPETGVELTRKARRYDKHKVSKGSRLVKEQFVPKIVTEKKVKSMSSIPIYEDQIIEKPFYKKGTKIIDETRAPQTIIKTIKVATEIVYKDYIIPAHTKLKRILTRVPQYKGIKVTEEILAKRKERSLLDKTKYLNKKELVPLNDLKKEFESHERRNGKYSENEGWSKTFNKLNLLVTSGITTINGKIVSLKKQAIKILINSMLFEESKLKWENTKINNFIRYLRLTTHGVFENKPVKTKKKLRSKVFEPSKYVTKIDNSKIKYNLPDNDKKLMIKFTDANGELESEAILKDGDMYKGNDFLCSLREVISWKYKQDKEYNYIIITEDGAFTQIPIKYKEKTPPDLQKFFDKQRIKKQKKNETRT